MVKPVTRDNLMQESLAASGQQQPAQPNTDRTVTSSHEISVSRVARYLNTSKMTIRRMLESGKLEGYQLAGERGWWKVTYDSVVAYINKVKHTYLPDSPPVARLSLPKTHVNDLPDPGIRDYPGTHARPRRNGE